MKLDLNMNIKEKMTLSLGFLVTLIIALVALASINLQILTATEPDSPVAEYGLTRALILILAFGGVCIMIGLWLMLKLPNSIHKPIKELSEGLNKVANHNYEVNLNFDADYEMKTVAEDFNRMVRRLQDYHRSAASDLMASKQFLETIINSMEEPILCLDRNMKVIYINDDALNVLNMKREMLIGNSVQELSMRNDLLRRLICGLQDNMDSETRSQSKKEPLKIYADNKECYFQVAYLPIRMKNKSTGTIEKRGDVILLKNVTEFHKLNMAKTTFISTISHELKTPISAILMSQQLLEDKRVGKLNDEQSELLKNIKDNGDRLLSITGELLNLTQVESGKLLLKPIVTRPIELIEYAIKANRVQADKFNINVEIEYPEEKISKLFVDSEKIAWVLTNLLSNAIRYSSEQGRAIIGACQKDARHVQIYVQDFGKGIDPRYHERIFEPYFRVPGTKVQGSGLGLSISRDFVEAHGGTLIVESEPGNGSRFVMTLPV